VEYHYLKYDKIGEEKMVDKTVLESLQKGQELYEMLQGKTFHYVYWKSGKHHEMVFRPKTENFMHLTGYRYQDERKGELKGKEFYKRLKQGKMKLERIKPSGKGFERQKLDVLLSLNLLLTCDVRIIDETVVCVDLRCDGGIRTGKTIFCLGVKSVNHEYVPMSLLDLRKDHKKVKGGHSVHCIYEVDHKVKKITQVAKNHHCVKAEEKRPYNYAYNYEVSEIVI